MSRLLLGCALALILATTATAKPITADQVAQFKPGVATAADVTASLGKPISESNSSDGSRILVYSWTNAHAKAVSFIPVIGLFAGGSTGSSASAIFIFGPDGLLKSATSNTTNVDCSMHVVTVDCGH